MGRMRLTEYRQSIYGPLEGRTAYFTDRKQDLWPTQSTIWKAGQRAPREGFPMYFLTSSMVLSRQLWRLYISGSIFQVPLVYNYSTYYTSRVPTRLIHQVHIYAFSVPTRLRVQCTPETLASQGGGALVYRLRSLPQQNRQSPLSKRVYDTIRISCPQTRLACTIKLVQTPYNRLNKKVIDFKEYKDA